MGDLTEPQQEEVEVLQSIYEGDQCYKQLRSTIYQYKVGDDGKARSCVLEVKWGPDYPDELPELNLDAFYNRHLTPEVKEDILNQLKEQGEAQLGLAMTYTLFEWLKENCDSLLAAQPEVSMSVGTEAESAGGAGVKKEKKEQLTKAQKRRMFDKFGTTHTMQDKPRGWDWVCILRHLAQTGYKDEP